MGDLGEQSHVVLRNLLQPIPLLISIKKKDLVGFQV
jgi:hypothetical protein